MNQEEKKIILNNAEEFLSSQSKENYISLKEKYNTNVARYSNTVTEDHVMLADLNYKYNQLTQKKKDLDKAITEKNNLLKQGQQRGGVLTKEEQERYTKATQKEHDLTNEISEKEIQFNEDFNAAKQFYKLDIENGHVVGINDAKKTKFYCSYDYNNGVKTYDSKTNNIIDNTNLVISAPSKAISETISGLQDNTIKNLKEIIKQLKNDPKSLSDQSWISLYNYNLKNENFKPYYDDIYNMIFDENFKYNIDRSTYNDTLVDIRNYHNFRSANNANAAMGYTVDKQNYTVYNPTKMQSSNTSKSFYMSKNDFYWSQNYNDIRGQKYSIQNIILNQYQPTLQYNIGRDIIKALDSGAGQLLDSLGIDDSIRSLINYGAGKVVEMEYNDELVKISENPSILYDNQNYMKKSNPMYYIQRLFNGGKWLNTYQLPFVSGGKVKNDYLKKSTQPGGWNIGGMTDNSGDNSLSRAMLHDRISIAIPTSPTFAVDTPHNATMSPINIDFYLINKNDLYLNKNFQFMQALFAGTQWLSMQMGVIAASNVYHVLVPGRFMIQWASLEAKIETAGKLRTNNYMYANYSQNVKMIQYDTLWPQAWKISLTIKPLTPWNFNTHMAYYLNGFGSNYKSRLFEASKQSIFNTDLNMNHKAIPTVAQRIDDLLDTPIDSLDVVHFWVWHKRLKSNGRITNRETIYEVEDRIEKYQTKYKNLLVSLTELSTTDVEATREILKYQDFNEDEIQGKISEIIQKTEEKRAQINKILEYLELQKAGINATSVSQALRITRQIDSNNIALTDTGTTVIQNNLNNDIQALSNLIHNMNNNKLIEFEGRDRVLAAGRYFNTKLLTPEQQKRMEEAGVRARQEMSKTQLALYEQMLEEDRTIWNEDYNRFLLRLDSANQRQHGGEIHYWNFISEQADEEDYKNAEKSGKMPVIEPYKGWKE